jgi:hypothetical protein
MPARPRIHALAAVVALAAPSGALAQGEPGAGDSQCSDPFAPQPSQQQQQQPQPAQAPGLPRTGLDVIPLAVAGVALVLAGLALWRRPHARR